MRINLTFPDNAVLIPKIPSKVNIGDPFYYIPSKNIVSIPVAKTLGIKPENIFNVITVSIYDSVSKSDVLAQKKVFFGMKKIRSHVNGKVIHIGHDDGEIHIEVSDEAADDSHKKLFSSFFTGTISQQKKNVCVVQIDKAKEITIPEIPKDFGGKIYAILQDSDWFNLNEETAQNSVIVTEIIAKSHAAKCEALDVSGFIIKKESDIIELPYVRIADINIFNQIKNHNGYIILSSLDKKALLY